MEKASKVMYSIANFFTWVLLIVCIAGIVVFSLMIPGIIPNNSGYGTSGLIAAIIYLSIVLIFCIITIAMVRRAKADNSSKGWDFLFLIFGLLGGNIFYVLGGIFGLVARR